MSDHNDPCRPTRACSSHDCELPSDMSCCEKQIDTKFIVLNLHRWCRALTPFGLNFGNYSPLRLLRSRCLRLARIALLALCTLTFPRTLRVATCFSPKLRLLCPYRPKRISAQSAQRRGSRSCLFPSFSPRAPVLLSEVPDWLNAWLPRIAFATSTITITEIGNRSATPTTRAISSIATT